MPPLVHISEDYRQGMPMDGVLEVQIPNSGSNPFEGTLNGPRSNLVGGTTRGGKVSQYNYRKTTGSQ